MKTMNVKLLCVVLVSTICLVCFVNGANQLLKNPDFEHGITNWHHDNFYMQTNGAHVHKGVASVKCTGRTRTYMGPGQDVQIKRNGRYNFISYIKLINDIPAKMYQMARAKIVFTHSNGKNTYFLIAYRPYLTSAEGWVPLGGDFVAPDNEWTNARLYIEGLDPHVDYYFDDASLTEIQTSDWKTEADVRIDNLRKNNIHFVINVDSHLNKSEIKLQIDHKRHLFGWGSVVHSDYMVDPDYQTYQNIVYYMFNWATIQDYKWRYNRGNRTNPDYKMAVAATDVLRKHGLKVRGHCMFWAVDNHSPDWVRTLDGDGVKQAVDTHIQYMTGITKGKLEHWDVNNELVHGHFFEEHTGDPYYTQHMFQQIHKADPKPKLFLNEYSVVSRGDATLAYLTQIKQLKAANVGLSMVGVQSHLNANPDVTLLKRRLDVLAQTGLPMWITELDIPNVDDDKQADFYEDVLQMYFSHASIEGVTLWGFWDHETDPDKALLHGYHFAKDKAGERFLHLTKEKWSTHVTKNLSPSMTEFDVRGFQGDYDVIVYYQGKPIKKTTFSLAKTDRTVSIQITKNLHEIQLPVATDPFQFISQPSEIKTDHHWTLGSASSTSQSSTLECVNRWSDVSGAGDDKSVEIQCHDDEVLTGCSSILKNHDWRRDGDKMVISDGKPACQAVNGFQSLMGIQAIARCCKLKDLSCDYRMSGPSPKGVNDVIVTPCLHNKLAFGCSASTYVTESDGSYFNHTSCSAQNDGSSSGVYSYAACCSGAHVKCQTVMSKPSDLDIGDVGSVACPTGTTMTGCNVFSLYGRAAGAFIATVQGQEKCLAFNGYKKYGNEEGVRAFASCCHV